MDEELGVVCSKSQSQQAGEHSHVGPPDSKAQLLLPHYILNSKSKLQVILIIMLYLKMVSVSAIVNNKRLCLKMEITYTL